MDCGGCAVRAHFGREISWEFQRRMFAEPIGAMSLPVPESATAIPNSGAMASIPEVIITIL
jgi:hypothetical protein